MCSHPKHRRCASCGVWFCGQCEGVPWEETCDACDRRSVPVERARPRATAARRPPPGRGGLWITVRLVAREAGLEEYRICVGAQPVKA